MKTVTPKLPKATPAQLDEVREYLRLNDLDLWGKKAKRPRVRKQWQVKLGCSLPPKLFKSLVDECCKFFGVEDVYRHSKLNLLRSDQWARVQKWIREHRREFDPLRETPDSGYMRIRRAGGIYASPSAVRESLAAEKIDLSKNPRPAEPEPKQDQTAEPSPAHAPAGVGAGQSLKPARPAHRSRKKAAADATAKRAGDDLETKTPAATPQPDETPAIRQWRQFKQQYPDYVVLFRMGDFYETFYDDAMTLSDVVSATLTVRNKDGVSTPMAGVPVHAVEAALRKMIVAGHRVALADPVDGGQEVTRLMTPTAA